MRWTTFLLLVVFLQLPIQAVATEVRVGINNNPPLTFVAADGQASGLFPELLEQVAEQRGWQLKFTPCVWPQCLEQLESGQIDLLPDIAYSDTLATKFRFIEQSLVSNWGQVYQRPGDHYDSILDLAGRRLAVQAGDSHYLGEQGVRQVAENFGIAVEFVEVPSYQDAFSLLARGDVDLALVGRIYGLKAQQQFNLLPAPIMLQPIQVRPAFSRHSPPALASELEQQIREWKSTVGSPYFQVRDKWLSTVTVTVLPVWLKALLSLLAITLGLMVLLTSWTRRQVRVKTTELAATNRQLAADLRARQQVEKELREQQQQYRVLFEDSPAIMLLIDPVTTEIVGANPSACTFYQYPRDVLQRMKINQLNMMSDGEVRDRVAQIGSHSSQRFEVRHRLADGQHRDVEIQCSPITVAGRLLFCSIVYDMSEHKLFSQELEQRGNFLQSVIDGVSDPLMVIALDYQVLQMNKAALAQLPDSGLLQEQMTCHRLSHGAEGPCSGETHPCPLLQVQETGQPVTVVHQHISKQGVRIVELNASPLYNSSGDLYAVIEVVRDITERQQIESQLNENERRLHHLAHHDSLTDLPNRLLFEDRLQQALSKAARSRKQVALLFLDLDHFKDINDNLGHDCGDLLLIDIANRLRRCVRESDTVARMGGDEFLVVLDEVDSVAFVEQMAQRVCSALIHEVTRGGYSQRISASIGISIYPEDGSSRQELFKAADVALYQAKSKGKANYQYASTPQGHLSFD